MSDVSTLSPGDPPPEPPPQGLPTGWQVAGPDPAGQYGIGGIHVASGEPSAALPMGMDPATPLHQPGWYDPMTNSYWPVAPAPWAPAPSAASYHQTPSPIGFAPASTLPQLPSWPQQGMQQNADAVANPAMVMWAMAPSAAPELAPAEAPGDAPPRKLTFGSDQRSF